MSLLITLAVLGGGVATIVWCTGQIVRAVRSLEAEARSARTASLLALFAPGLTAAQEDPKALLVWQPLASTARRLFPAEFAALDAAHAGPFPFAETHVEAAHARWTAEWLAWERSHDGEFKLKAAAAEEDLAGGGALARARLDAIEQEKLERYQRRYEEYVRVAKALQGLTGKEPKRG